MFSSRYLFKYGYQDRSFSTLKKQNLCLSLDLQAVSGKAKMICSRFDVKLTLCCFLLQMEQVEWDEVNKLLQHQGFKPVFFADPVENKNLTGEETGPVSLQNFSIKL